MLEFMPCVQIAPVLNQIQAHIFFQRLEFLELLQQKGIVMQAWSPFIAGKKSVFENELLQKIARKHQKSVAAVILRFLTQLGMSVIPKASSLVHLRENLEIFDFVLDSKAPKTT
ncbi:aldo/keto reductase [Helicobacter himalayensis]|uniref:aldo/keto reductase n=1 Tax=Helicobacter himalayensis TaxID=1591088 RepID=UPI003D6E500B